MILTEKQQMMRELFRKFAETEFTDELLDKLEETANLIGIYTTKWESRAFWELRF